LLEKYVWKINKMPDFLHDSCPKNYQNTRIFMIFAEKLTKFALILHDFCPKNGRILHKNCPKNNFPYFFRGGGVSYAYGITSLKCKKCTLPLCK